MKTEDAGGAFHAERGPGWVRLEDRSRWEELVLPEDSRRLLRSISADLRARDRAASQGAKRLDGRSPGLKLLFTGERGTGKKMASRILAAELDRAVFSVDLASVLSQDSVETEHRLERIFATADGSQAILYFSDVEAWFGKRSPVSDDGWTSMAVSQLVRRIEGYRGVVVFATALMSEIDDELIGRVDYLVDFPFPDEEARKNIWRLLLPAEARVNDRDLEFLASSFQLPGGAIRDCCAAAAAAATHAGVALDMRHIVQAVEEAYVGRIQGARTREALERFHRGTWVNEPPATTPEAGAAPTRAVPRARPIPARPLPGLRDRRPVLLAAVVAVVVAAVVGFLIAHGSSAPASSAPALDQHASAGLLQVSFPSGWQRRSPPGTPQLALKDELALAPKGSAGGVLVIGRTDTTDRTLLPQSILAALSSTPTAQIVSLRGAQFDRYLNLPARGVSGRESVYALPTTVGTVLGVCLQGSGGTSFASTCERIVGSIRLASGSVLGIGPSASYASGLSAAITQLNAARSAPASQLRNARVPATQATAAAALASAYVNAASAVTRLQAGTAQSANLAVASALRSTGNAYAALGHAAASSDATGYASATKSVTLAQSALSAAFSQLAKLGYAVG
jgi:hypothetical protein